MLRDGIFAAAPLEELAKGRASTREQAGHLRGASTEPLRDAGSLHWTAWKMDWALEWSGYSPLHRINQLRDVDRACNCPRLLHGMCGHGSDADYSSAPKLLPRKVGALPQLTNRGHALTHAALLLPGVSLPYSGRCLDHACPVRSNYILLYSVEFAIEIPSSCVSCL